MKSVIIALSFLMAGSSAMADAPKKVTVCGTYQVASSDGMLPVVVHWLFVPVDGPAAVSEQYRLSAAGMNMAELNKREKLLKSMVEGRNYCVTGKVTTRPGNTEILIDKVKGQN